MTDWDKRRERWAKYKEEQAVSSCDFDYKSEEFTAMAVGNHLHKIQTSYCYPIEAIPSVSENSQNTIHYKDNGRSQLWKILVCLADQPKTPWAVQLIGRHKFGGRRCLEEPFWLGGLDRLERLCDNLINVGCAPECVIMGPMAYGFWEWSNKCTAQTAGCSTSSEMEPSELPLVESKMGFL